jgi:hypothetical protein
MRRLSLVAGFMLALAATAPVAANTTERFVLDDTFSNEYSCGAVVTTRAVGDVIVHHGKDGAWLFGTIHIRYFGEAANPATGEVIHLTGRQIMLERPTAVALMGQGMFLHLPGEGVLLGDVGRFVFDPADGSTLASSSHVIRFDDPSGEARIDAAVCSLFD